MGNKKSTPKPTHEHYVQRDTNNAALYEQPVRQQDVHRRNKKKKDKKERPLSDPGTITGSVNELPESYDQFYLRPISSGRDQRQINGKGITGMTSVPVADYESHAVLQPTIAQIEQYRQSLQQVLRIWPEYSPVKEINVHDLSTDVLTTLQQVASRLYQQHNSIKKLAEDFHELKQVFDELQEERDSLKQILEKKDVEVKALQEDCAILLGELRRRGHDVKLPNRTVTTQINPDYNSIPNYDSDNIMTPRSDTSSFDRNDELDSSLNRRRSTKEKIYSPTPLLIAEGDRSRVSLAKKLSMQRDNGIGAVSQQISSTGEKWTWPESNASDDLKERVNWLQEALQKEKEVNRMLRNDQSSPRMSRSVVSKQVSVEELRGKYTTIQAEAFDRVRKQVINHLNNVNEDRQRAFICYLMEASYQTAKETVEQFHKVMTKLITSPVNLKSTLSKLDSSGGHQKPRRTGSILDNVRIFEEKSDFKSSKRPDIPNEILDNIFLYLSSNANKADITDLIETTIDRLTHRYPECCTPMLLNQSAFTNFLHSTCRLSWQLNTHTPPLHLTTEIDNFEGRYHVTTSDQARQGDSIKLYLWPVLLSKRHGDVLCKGIVHI